MGLVLVAVFSDRAFDVVGEFIVNTINKVEMVVDNAQSLLELGSLRGYSSSSLSVSTSDSVPESTSIVDGATTGIP